MCSTSSLQSFPLIDVHMVMAPHKTSRPLRWTRSNAVLGSLLFVAIFSKAKTSNSLAAAPTTPNAVFSVLSIANFSCLIPATVPDPSSKNLK